MPSQLINHASEYDAAIDQVLSLCVGQLDIFDRDLSTIKLERPERIARLQQLLSNPTCRLRIIVQDSAKVLVTQPRLLRLLDTYSAQIALQQGADTVLELPDAMLIADATHAVIRFHRDHLRGKVIDHDASSVTPYQTRFLDIFGEGGYPIGARATGL